MRELNIKALSVLGVDLEGHWLANSDFRAHKINLVLGLNLVVVFWVDEGQRQHSLLLQVGFVDTGKASGDDSKTAKMSGLKSSVLS